MLQALAHSGIIFTIASFSISNNIMTCNGYSSDLWVFSISIYSSIVLVVNVKIAMNTKYWTMMMFLSIMITSISIYFLYVFVANLIEEFNVYLTAEAVFTMPNYYLIIIFNVTMVISFDMLILYL